MMQVLPGGHGARTYQDERFSYVVLRRGARPTPDTVPELTIARQRQIDPPDAVQQAIEAGEIHCLEPKSCVSVQKPHCIARGQSHPQATVYCNGAIPWQGLITQQGAITRHMLTMHAGSAGRLNIRWNLMVTMFVFSCGMLSVCLASGHIDSVCIHQIWTSVVSASKPRHTSCEYWPCSSLVSLLHACYLGSPV